LEEVDNNQWVKAIGILNGMVAIELHDSGFVENWLVCFQFFIANLKVTEE
jgi:hypothetical protein